MNGVAPSGSSPPPPPVSEGPRIADLTAKLLNTSKELMGAQTELRGARAECEQLRRRGAVDRARVDELEAELARLRELEARRSAELATAARLSAELEQQNQELQRSVAAAIERVAELEARLASAPARVARDDLTRIRGIGPAFARTLTSNGVSSFAVIATWSEEDVARIAALLKIRPERIRRDDWIGAARALLEASSSE